MVGESLVNDSSCVTKQRFSLCDNFLKCGETMQDCGKKETGLNSLCDMSYNLQAPQKDQCSWSMKKEAAVDNNSNWANMPQITTASQDNLVGLTCPTESKCFPTVVGFCFKMNEGPSLSTTQASHSPPQVIPCSSKLEMPMACYSLTAVLQPGSNGPKCGTTEMTNPDPTSPKVQKSKPARFSNLNQLVGITCSPETTALQEGPVAVVPSHQSHATTGPLTCLVGELCFGNLPSPKVSPVKLNAEIALSPKCGDALLAFVMESELPSNDESEEEDNDELEFWCYNDQSEDQDKACSFKNTEEPKVEEDPVLLEEGLADGALDVDKYFQSSGWLAEVNRKWLEIYGSDCDFSSDEESEEDDDDELGFWCYDDQEEACSLKNPEEPKVEEDPISLLEWLEGGALDADSHSSSSGLATPADDESEEDGDWDDSSDDELPEIQVPPPRTCSSDQTPPLKKVSFASDNCLIVVHEFEPYDTKGPWEEIARDRCRRKDKGNLVIGPILRSAHRDMVYRTRILPWIIQHHCNN